MKCWHSSYLECPKTHQASSACFIATVYYCYMLPTMNIALVITLLVTQGKRCLWLDSSTRCASSLKVCTKLFTFILFLSVLRFSLLFRVIIKNILQYVLAEMFWDSSYSYLMFLLITFKKFNVSLIIYSCSFGT